MLCIALLVFLNVSCFKIAINMLQKRTSCNKNKAIPYLFTIYLSTFAKIKKYQSGNGEPF